jgi:hypothetical protein
MKVALNFLFDRRAFELASCLSGNHSWLVEHSDAGDCDDCRQSYRRDDFDQRYAVSGLMLAGLRRSAFHFSKTSNMWNIGM